MLKAKKRSAKDFAEHIADGMEEELLEMSVSDMKRFIEDQKEDSEAENISTSDILKHLKEIKKEHKKETMKGKIKELVKAGKSDEEIKKIIADEDDVYRMEEIRDEMMELLSEAKELVQGTEAKDQFDSYTYPHITMALVKEHEFLGSNYSFEDAIEDMKETEEEDLTEVELEEKRKEEEIK